MKKTLLLPILALLAAGQPAATLAQTTTAATRALPALAASAPRLAPPHGAAVGRPATLTRPGRTVRYSWDEAAAAWVEPTTILNTYDGRGALTEEVTADSATGHNQYRTQYAYDAQGLNTLELNQGWDGSAWQNQRRFVATYDAQGNTTEELQQNWRNGAWATADGSRYANAYSPAGVLVSRTETRWDNGAFVNWSRELYTVVNNQWTALTGQNWEQGAWMDAQRLTDLVWHDWASRRIAAATKQEWAGTWEDLSYLTATYDANGSSIFTAQVPVVGGGRVNDVRYSDFYNAYGHYVAYREESWQAGAWQVTDEESHLLTYDAADHLTRRTVRYFDTQATPPRFVNTERFNHSGFVTITRVKPTASAQAAFQLFPNPASGLVTLQWAAPAGALTGDVLNALGQPVLRFALPPQAAQLDVTALPAGLYTVRLHTAQGTLSQRLVRQ